MKKFLLCVFSVLSLSLSAFAGTYDHAVYTGLDLEAGSPVKFFDSGDVHYVSLQAPTLAGNTSYVLPAVDGSAGQALVTDGAGHLSWSSGHLVSEGKYDWVAADGSTKSITHGFNTTDLIVQVWDSNGAQITVNPVVTNANVLTLTAGSPPTGNGWRVLVIAL